MFNPAYFFGSGSFGSVVTSGLVLFLDPTNASSWTGTGSTILDLSGNSNHGTLNSVTGAVGQKYLTFSGSSSSYISFPTATINIGKVYTINVFAKQTSISGAILGGATSAGNYHFNANNTATLGNRVNGSLLNPASFNAYNIWCHFTITRNNTAVQIYKNGVLFGTYTQSSWTTDFLLHFLGKTNDNNLLFGGDLGTTIIYNRVLSASEILQNFNAKRIFYGL